MIPGRKLCNSPHHQGPRWILALNFNANGWQSEEKLLPQRLQSICKTCQRVNSRMNNGIRNRGVPYNPQKPSLRREDVTEFNRQRRARYKLNAEYINERRRKIYAEQKVRREYDYTKHKEFIDHLPNRHPRRRVAEVVIANTNDIYSEKLVPVGPFRLWLNNWRAQPGNYLCDLANFMGINEARLRRIANASRTYYYSGNKKYVYPTGQANITLDFVDRCLIAAGANTMLWELYDNNDHA
jgi:hypothetical protein